MEILLEQAPASPEQRIVDLYERRYNDATTLAAEILDGSMRTSFDFEFDGKDLVAQDGSSLGEVFEKAEEEAYVIAQKDPRLSCEIRRRKAEKDEYLAMIDMAKGLGPNTMIVTSEIPAEANEWGEDVGGYNVTRKQAMLRTIHRLPDGRIRVVSQSLDRSDREGLERIHSFFGTPAHPGELLQQRIHANIHPDRQDLLVDELTREYDRALEERSGGRYYAGRTPVVAENTYQFVLQQKDLIDVFMQDQTDDNLFGLVAALENRWNVHQSNHSSADTSTESHRRMNEYIEPRVEMHLMAQKALQENKVYSGCGVTMKGLSEAEDQLDALGFGNKTDEKLSWHGGKIKQGTCVSCNEGPKDVGVKSWCKDCISGHCGSK